MGIESGKVHRNSPQIVLNSVKLTHNVVHTLTKRVAGHLKVVIDIVNLIAKQGDSAIALQHLEIEPGADEAGLCLQRAVKRLFFT